jgi:putative FmdB family regulatory protein
MPIYEYECEACGNRFEQIQKFSDSPIEVCPKCGQRQVRKLLSSPAFQFKGSGWYVTDYARKGGEGSESSKSGEAGDAKTDAKGKAEKTPAAAGSSEPSSAAAGSKDSTKAEKAPSSTPSKSS